ncbi:MAG: L-2-amino-thiazoline-4-carboxylic acid hydrolase [Candidatus Bipolaricaulia bacterium]
MDVRQFAMAENVVATTSLAEELPSLLAAFNDFQAHIREQAPEHLGGFEDALRRSLREQTPTDRTIPPLDALPKNLDDLQRAYLAYVLHLLGRSGDEPDRQFEIDRSDAFRARLYPAFFRTLALCDVLGREHAVPLLKDYVDERTRRLTTADLTLQDLDHWWDELVDPDSQLPTSGVAGRFHRGKIAFRIDRCLLHEVMQPLSDPQISFLVCCYGDTANVEAINPNFNYACPMTLVEGDPYCNKCIHDKRFVDAIEDPSREFYDELGRGQ